MTDEKEEKFVSGDYAVFDGEKFRHIAFPLTKIRWEALIELNKKFATEAKPAKD